MIKMKNKIAHGMVEKIIIFIIFLGLLVACIIALKKIILG